jgi:hypothetical protein
MVVGRPHSARYSFRLPAGTLGDLGLPCIFLIMFTVRLEDEILYLKKLECWHLWYYI